MTEGLVSVVIPVYNRPGLLVEAVESVVAQSYSDWEVILVDDGSTDDTPETIRGLIERYPDRFRMVRQQNAGPGSAREAGRRESHGEFVQFLDSDDKLLAAKFEAQIASLRRRPSASVSYGPTRLERRDGSVEEPVRSTGERFSKLFPSLLLGRPWMTATPLYKASICEAAGGWSDLRLDEDWEFEARIGALDAELVRVEETVAVHQDHSGERAGFGDPLDPERVRHQAEAHARIYQSALRAGVKQEAPEMARFARALFLLARKAGAAGLAGESRRLFGLARRASTRRRARGFDFLLYGTAAMALGWTTVGRLAMRRERKAAR